MGAKLRFLRVAARGIPRPAATRNLLTYATTPQSPLLAPRCLPAIHSAATKQPQSISPNQTACHSAADQQTEQITTPAATQCWRLSPRAAAAAAQARRPAFAAAAAAAAAGGSTSDLVFAHGASNGAGSNGAGPRLQDRRLQGLPPLAPALPPALRYAGAAGGEGAAGD
jgi:hypothetical protein